jgi:glycosyltransferase involved in cell wall biosynthesis
MRVLYCEGNIDGTVGGSYFSLLYLVSNLDRSRFEPIVVFHEDNDLIPTFREHGVETKVIQKEQPFAFLGRGSPVSGRFRAILLPVVVVRKIVNMLRFLVVGSARRARFLRRNNIDLLHLNNSVTRNHDWMIGAILSRTRCITHERGINDHYSTLSKSLAKRLDAIICISNAVRDSLIRGGVSTNSAHTIYNGIDPDILRARRTPEDIRHQYDVESSARLIGVIGNIKRWKGQETLVHAMPTILKEFPTVVCLLIGDIAPSDMEYGRLIHQQVEHLGLNDNVIVTGYTNDVASHISALEVVIHTSIDPEPFGRVLIEAMSMKKPLIGARAGAVPEIISEEETGLTFTPGDSADLADKIMLMLRERDAANSMGRRGYARLMRNFHISENAARTQQLYTRLLDR